YTPPVVGRGEKLKPRELLLTEHIPKAEFDPQTPVGFEARLPRHQRLAVDDAPVAKARLHIDVTHLLDEGSLGQRTKKTGPLEIVADDRRNISADACLTPFPAKKIRNGDGQRIDIALRDIDLMCR